MKFNEVKGNSSGGLNMFGGGDDNLHVGAGWERGSLRLLGF
jgi:hypothetical protein